MVKQLQLTNWPSGQPVPSSRNSVLRLVSLIDQWRKQQVNWNIYIYNIFLSNSRVVFVFLLWTRSVIWEKSLRSQSNSRDFPGKNICVPFSETKKARTEYHFCWPHTWHISIVGLESKNLGLGNGDLKNIQSLSDFVVPDRFPCTIIPLGTSCSEPSFTCLVSCSR